jgi:hypothetical protein
MAVDRRERRSDRRRLVGVVGGDAGRPAPRASAQLLAQALRPVRPEELVETRVVGGPELRDDDRGGFSPS